LPFVVAAMIDKVRPIISQSAAFQRLVEETSRVPPGAHVLTAGIAGSLDAVIISCLAEALKRPLAVVVSDAESAERVHDDLVACLGQDGVGFFAAVRAHGPAESTREVHDAQALALLRSSFLPVLVTHARALLVGLPRPDTLGASTFLVQTGALRDLEETVTRLRTVGFNGVDFVDGHGDFALRGGILDIFPFTAEHPVRIEFSGDSVESIREFDPVSQRSIRALASVSIAPDPVGGLPGNAGERRYSLLDYLSQETILFLDEIDRVRAALAQHESEGPGTARPAGQTMELFDLFPQIRRAAVPTAGSRAIDFESRPQPSFNGAVRVLRQSLARFLEQSYTVFIGSDSAPERERLRELLETIGEDPRAEGGASPLPDDLGAIDFSLEVLHEGFIVPPLQLAVLAEHQIFNRLKRRGRRRKPRFKGFSERDLQQLHRGDYVVHEDFGIGKFERLQKIHVRNVEQEVARVLYDGNDVLYVNLNYINKLQKYSSREGVLPALTRLGSPDWERLKQRAKRRMKDIARDLIALYAKRKALVGFAFPPDSAWQKELEASFMFEDTFDQAKATLEVKQDMEASNPMDRLVCGDVGFGKTEVAVRAAFKCVLGGKQVALLVPTTILALQHGSTFLGRVGRYGVDVRVFSRLKSPREQKLILEHLRVGAVDVIIGTHRLLSKDVAFRDLGLLIIDEEHRFGVAAKEKLRALRAEVDTLTLTATPIPRTLHFSLLGARDLSLIGTPPRNRLPIITEILQWDDETIGAAVRREVQRGGQVYFVHDRVQNIDEIVGRLQRILPAVRIHVAHGQMPSHALEEVMLDFLEKRVDVLVSTKIIESGLDIPNVNTIIVNRADRFGMAELYQLRGRVGRSNVQAYAYLIVPPISVLPKATLRRLQAIEEFTELGSGFNLAMRDLEIRGAGNLLGAEQSGFIETMGFETYTRILEEAVRELKEQEFQNLFVGAEGATRGRTSTVVEVDFDALIPETYVASDVERLALYRRLYALASDAQLEEACAELLDRFGKMPPEAESLFHAVHLRLAAGRIGFAKVHVSERLLEADFPPEDSSWFYEGESFQRIMEAVAGRRDGRISLRQEGKSLRLMARIGDGDDPGHPLQQALQILTTLIAT
jgi:transcription-repair coupling factor (superfamily II helicase)